MYDKGVYPLISLMIRTYLGEEPIVENKENTKEFREMVEKNFAEYIVQHPIDFSTHVLCSAEPRENCTCATPMPTTGYTHPLCAPETVKGVAGTITRVAAPSSRLVNISSGGVMKDTWILG